MPSHTRHTALIRVAAALLPGAAVVATVATGASATTASPTTEPAMTMLPATTVAPGPLERQPLTGVPIGGGVSYTPRPAMVVKIDNVEAGRNQAGLNQADVVFEEIIEGRATRFAAVFNSMQADPVGPIRSGRTQDVLLLACLNDPVFVWSGGNPGVTQALQATGWTVLGDGSPGFFRNTDRPRPHNLFANMSELWPQAGDAGNAVPIFEYTAPGQDVAGTPASFVEMMVGSYPVRWDWDPQQGFLRSQFGAPHQLTDGQASANTVVVLVVQYLRSPVDSRSPEAQTVGGGPTSVYNNGRKIEGTWTRAQPTDPFTLESGGEPILIAPGRTWVELVDDQHQLTDG